MGNKVSVKKSEIKLNEVEKAINKLKIEKAPGADRMRQEMIKYVGKKGKNILLRIMSKIWATHQLPEDWKLAIITTIHEKGGKTNYNNYRGISLYCVGY